MKKILFITNISSGVGSFSIASIKAAHVLGLRYYMAGDFSSADKENLEDDEKQYDISYKQIDLDRSPYSSQNLNAFNQLVDFIQAEHIDYIHCNTPIGGLLGRLAGEKCGVKKVIYQAHGFHFYDGAPKKNWLVYYPIEKWLAKKTDAIITINQEDFERAKSFKLRNNGKVYYVPGVGIDLSQYKLQENIREIKRAELGLKDKDIALISAGELNQNKNNKVIIEAITSLQDKNIHYYLCGVGETEDELRDLVKEKNIEEQVHFLGYRTDVKELLKAADIFVMPSFREGLSRSIMEAMACGLPCVVSKIRGNVDLIDNKGGFLCEATNAAEFSNAILQLKQSEIIRTNMGEHNHTKIKNFDLNYVAESLGKIYREIFDGSL